MFRLRLCRSVIRLRYALGGSVKLKHRITETPNYRITELLCRKAATELLNESEGGCPLVPAIEELMAREDLLKGYDVEIWEFC